MYVAENPKPSSQIQASKTNSTHEKENEGIYKQSNQQRGVTGSVYCEHEDKMD
jgi:hypothetical protein